ncbi:MAG: preprotein translocase subunit SecG [Chitinophagaceae bacterium]|nr:preprotein translocase subunit SecG [Chitinophagaceae bacterium]
MTILFVILIIIASAVLGLLVLIQNPKGGGLAGNIAGFSTQFMGVKQTTDVLEKGTWIFAAVIAILSVTSSVFISKAGGLDEKIEKVNPNAAQPQQPAAKSNTTTFPTAPDSGKK